MSERSFIDPFSFQNAFYEISRYPSTYNVSASPDPLVKCSEHVAVFGLLVFIFYFFSFPLSSVHDDWATPAVSVGQSKKCLFWGSQ